MLTVHGIPLFLNFSQKLKFKNFKFLGLLLVLKVVKLGFQAFKIKMNFVLFSSY